jgi:hypothetical protein
MKIELDKLALLYVEGGPQSQRIFRLYESASPKVVIKHCY